MRLACSWRFSPPQNSPHSECLLFGLRSLRACGTMACSSFQGSQTCRLGDGHSSIPATVVFPVNFPNTSCSPHVHTCKPSGECLRCAGAGRCSEAPSGGKQGLCDTPWISTTFIDNVSVQALVEAQGHYLEAEPCLGDPSGGPEEEPLFVDQKLQALQAEAKYLHNAVISSLKQPQLIRYNRTQGAR